MRVLAIVLVFFMFAARPVRAQRTKGEQAEQQLDRSTCAFAALPPRGFIVAPATRNVIWVTASSVRCARSLVDQRTIMLSSTDGMHMSASVAEPRKGVQALFWPKKQIDELLRTLGGDGGRTECNSCNLILTVHDVPTHDSAQLTYNVTGTVWDASGTSPPALGKLTAQVVKLQTTKLIVGVRSDGGSRQVVRTPENGKLIAAAREIAKDERPYVTNAAELSTPSSVVSPEWNDRWHIVDTSWGGSVHFHCINSPSDTKSFSRIIKNAPKQTRCVVRADRLLFGVDRRLQSPLVVDLELVDGTGTSIIRTTVSLASEARAESLPIPLWRTTAITCASDRILRSDIENTIYHADVLAIDDDAVTTGKCVLSFSYDFQYVFGAETSPKGKRDWREVVERGGPQGVEISVTRGTAVTKYTKTLYPLLDGGEQTIQIPLDAPIGSPEQSGPYTVEVHLKSTDDAHYIEGSFDESQSGRNPDTRVAMLLRPRGGTGTTYPVRLSVTFPVTPVAVRLPALRRDIARSSANTDVQLEGPRTGVMAVLELWDYRQQRNKLPIPLQFQTGFVLLKLEDRPKDVNFLLGGTISLPIAGEGKTETSISIGGFWEHSFGQYSQDSLLITFSIDIFKPIATTGS